MIEGRGRDGHRNKGALKLKTEERKRFSETVFIRMRIGTSSLLGQTETTGSNKRAVHLGET